MMHEKLGMIPESAVIIVIYLILLTAFLRTKHIGYAVVTLPVVIIPFAHLIAQGILFATDGNVFNIHMSIVLAFVDVIALCLTCVMIVLMSHRIQSTTNRKVYLTLMIIYTVILGWIYIFDNIHVALL